MQGTLWSLPVTRAAGAAVPWACPHQMLALFSLRKGRVATVARRVLVSIDLDTNQPVSSRWRSKSE